MAFNIHSKKINTAFLLLGFPMCMADKDLVPVPKKLLFSINNPESLLCWIVWFVLFLTFLLLKWENIHWEFFSFKKGLSTKEQSNILESLKVYIFLKFLFECPTHREPHNKVGSQSLTDHLVGLNWEPSHSYYNALTY